MLALTVVLVSCKKDPADSSANRTSADLSAKIIQLVDNYFPDAYITDAYTVDAENVVTVVTLNTTEVIAFDQNDDFLGYASSFNIEGGGPCGTGGGNHGGGNHGGGPGNGHHGGGSYGSGHGHRGIPIPLDSLPAAITTYITLNYPADTLKCAMSDTMCSVTGGAVIKVILKTTSATFIKLVFTPAGIYLMTTERDLYANVPTAVSGYVTTNYATYTPATMVEKCTLPTTPASFNYVIFLKSPTSKKRVTIKDDGTFICED